MSRLNALRSSLIGLPILSLCLVLILGSLQLAISLLLSSILCTLGIALVFWWFVAWAIGKIIIAIYQTLTRGWRNRDRPTPTIHDLTPQQQAMINYVQTVLSRTGGDRAANSQAMTTQQINTALQQAGWSFEEIEAAYAWIAQQAPSADPSD